MVNSYRTEEYKWRLQLLIIARRKYSALRQGYLSFSLLSVKMASSFINNSYSTTNWSKTWRPTEPYPLITAIDAKSFIHKWLKRVKFAGEICGPHKKWILLCERNIFKFQEQSLTDWSNYGAIMLYSCGWFHLPLHSRILSG